MIRLPPQNFSRREEQVLDCSTTSNHTTTTHTLPPRVRRPVMATRAPGVASVGQKRFRNFSFTLNNWQDKPDLVAKLNTLKCRYLVYGREVGEEGTPHLQGTVVFGNSMTESAARKKLKGCHIEVCASLEHSIAYCKKDGDFEERGSQPMTQKAKGEAGCEAQQLRWKGIRLAAEEGRLDDIPEDIRFFNYKCINYHRSIGLKRRRLEDAEEPNLWYHGPTGTGKSKKAREDHPEAYLKGCNKWWDGYIDESTVLIEDFDRKHDVLCHHMKIWADRYPFNAEVKGGSTGNIRPRKIIVTSNYHPSEIWTSEQDLEPILRRFKTVKFGEYPERKGTANCPDRLREFANAVSPFLQ